jgi:head-tail adaptor
MSDLLPIASLRDEVVVEAPVDTPDDTGGVVRSYADFVTLRVRLRALTGDMVWQGARQDQRITHEAICRARDDLTGEMRLRFGSRLLVVLAVQPFDERGLFLRLLCEEVKP